MNEKKSNFSWEKDSKWAYGMKQTSLLLWLERCANRTTHRFNHSVQGNYSHCELWPITVDWQTDCNWYCMLNSHVCTSNEHLLMTIWPTKLFICKVELVAKALAWINGVSICMLLTHSQHLITKKDNLCQGLDSTTDCPDCCYWLNHIEFLFLMRCIPLSLPQIWCKSASSAFFSTLQSC